MLLQINWPARPFIPGLTSRPLLTHVANLGKHQLLTVPLRPPQQLYLHTTPTLHHLSQRGPFLFFGDAEVTDNLSMKEDFPLHGELVPARLINRCPSAEIEPLWKAINGRTSLSQLGLEMNLPAEKIYGQINKLIKERAITFCPLR